MKRIGLVFAIAFSLPTLTTFGQIKFEEGYFISNDGQRTLCQIRNVDWKYNPSSFEYRSGEGSESKTATMDQVTEFGIVKEATFKRFHVQIDKSSTDLDRINDVRNPVFVDEILFLRVLVEGKGSVYEYNAPGLLRFFYSVDQLPVQQLVYKRYMATTVDAAWNEQYKQQLFNDMKCPTISQRDVEGTDYARRDLMKYFGKFNTCDGTGIAGASKEPEKKGSIQLTLRPGLTYNSATLKNTATGSTTEFESTPSYRIGIELENILPFNKGVWSMLFEPAYQAFSTNAKTGSAKIDYSSIELNFGVRRYFFQGDTKRFYANANLVLS